MRQRLYSDGKSCPYCKSTAGYAITRTVRQHVVVQFTGVETVTNEEKDCYPSWIPRSGKCDSCGRVFRLRRPWEVTEETKTYTVKRALGKGLREIRRDLKPGDSNTMILGKV